MTKKLLILILFISFSCENSKLKYNQELGAFEKIKDFGSYQTIELFNADTIRTDSFTMIDDVLHGGWYKYNERGMISSIRNWQSDKISGVQKYFEPSGLIKSETWYFKDSLFLQKYFFHDIELDSFALYFRPIIRDDIIDLNEGFFVDFNLKIPSEILLDSFKIVDIKLDVSTNYQNIDSKIIDTTFTLSKDFIYRKKLKLDEFRNINLEMQSLIFSQGNKIMSDTFSFRRKYGIIDDQNDSLK